MQAEEAVDNAVKEAISKPWLPLPIGLKPPSIDSVLAELSRQGINSIPPSTKGSNLSWPQINWFWWWPTTQKGPPDQDHVLIILFITFIRFQLVELAEWE